jgi:tripartite-type tricarboxylate transporter receptor subunit TctC
MRLSPSLLHRLAGIIALGVTSVYGQNYPTKPIRFVTSGVGGSPDIVARLTAAGLTASLGQQVIVDNRSSGVVPGETVSKAQPDGYTLLSTSGILWTGPLLQSKTPYNPVTDFAPITLAGTVANILVVNASLPVGTVRELIEYCKARPGKLNYASSSMGSSSHLAAELFRAIAGVDIVQINYKGAGPALNGLLTGESHLAFTNAASVATQVSAGRLKALATGSAEPSALTPGLPTLAASGVPGYESVQAVAIFAPVRTPTMLVERLNREIVLVLNATEVRSRLANVGVEIVASSPAMLAVKMKSEMVRLGKVIKDAGIRVE